MEQVPGQDFATLDLDCVRWTDRLSFGWNVANQIGKSDGEQGVRVEGDETSRVVLSPHTTIHKQRACTHLSIHTPSPDSGRSQTAIIIYAVEPLMAIYPKGSILKAARNESLPSLQKIPKQIH